MTAMLHVSDLHARYGTAHVLFGISFDIDQGETLALLGRNGAGKSTTIKSVMNLEPQRTGEIAFNGRSIIGLGPSRIAKLGVGYVPAERRIYSDLTVRENLGLGKFAATKERAPVAIDAVLDMLPLLRPLLSRKGGNLSGGEQQALAVARALVGNPELLLLDEPSEGLAPVIVEQLAEAIRALRREYRLTVLLTEQNLAFAFALADSVCVIDQGHAVFTGPMEEFRGQKDLQQRYLAV